MTQRQTAPTRRLRLLLDVDTAGVTVHSVEFGHAADLDDDWALSTSRFARPLTTLKSARKPRSKRVTQERIDNSHPLFGLTYDTDEYRTALTCIRLREDGRSWREIEHEA